MSWLGRPWFGAAAAALSGTLMLASGDFGYFGPLALIAPVPVLAYALASPKAWSVATSAFAARLIGGLGMVWAYHAVLPVPALAAWVTVHAAIFAALALLTRWIARGASTAIALAAFPILSTAAEFLFGLVSPHGSFGAVGYALTDLLPLLQAASVGGLPALAFLAGLAAATGARLLIQPRAWRTTMLLGGTPLALAALLGAWRLQQPYDERIRVGLVAIDPLIMRAFAGDAEAEGVARRYAEAVETLAAARPAIVVLPEKVFATSAAPLQGVANSIGATVVAGFDETLPDGRRVNAARVFAPNGKGALYLKRKMIPGLESDYAPGDAPLVLEGRGVAICKDLDFPAMIREYGRLDARLLLVPAWDFVVDGRMHSRMAVMRGVENGFAVARAASAGRLTLSDRYGRIVAESVTDLTGTSTLVGELGLRSGRTISNRAGDLFGWLCAAAAACLIALRALRARSRGTI